MSAPNSWQLFRRVLGLFRPYRGWMALGVLLSLASALAGIGLLGLSGRFLASMGLAGVAGATLNYFTPAAIIRGFAIVRTAGRYGERLLNHEATLRALSGLRVWLFARLLPLAPARTGFLGHAELFSRLRADVDRLEHAYLAVLLPLLVAAIALPLVTAVLAWYAWPVALISALTLLLAALLVPYQLARRSAAASAAMVALEAQLCAVGSDALLGAAELAVYGGEEIAAMRIATLTARHGEQRQRLDRLQALGGALVPLLAQLAATASLLLGAWALSRQAIAPAQLAMLVLLVLAQFELVASLPEAFSQLGATLVSAGRIFALTDALPAVVDPVAPLSPPPRTDIRFRQVRLRYADDLPWALNGLDLELSMGRRLALVGPSGAGKSSLIQALLRFQPIQSGRIELGGQPLEAYAGDDIRGLISVVEQRTHIFNGSLLDNLLVVRPDATQAQLARALRAAQLDAFVAGLPDGLETWLGEGGVLISGGEARRVAIARALLADRPILLLDEPTEGLDAVTAQALLAALASLMAGRSVLLITHRLGGLAGLVDEVLSLREGRIVASEPVAEVP